MAPWGERMPGKKERAKEAKAEKRGRKHAATASAQFNWQVGMGVTAAVIAVCAPVFGPRPRRCPARAV